MNSVNRRSALASFTALPFIQTLFPKTDAQADTVSVPKVNSLEDLIANIESRWPSDQPDGHVDPTELNLSLAPTGEPYVNIGWHPKGIKQPLPGVLQDAYIDNDYEFIPVGELCEWHENNPYAEGKWAHVCRCVDFKFRHRISSNGSGLTQRAPLLSYPNERAAVTAALSAFDAYAKNKNVRVLFWRYPEKASLVWREDGDLRDDSPAMMKASGLLKPDDEHVCRVELRLLLSTKAG